tara:strand:+ start:2226 stop:2663 length:438 start_codon:yes stop_codon:yes gene_type:complete
MKEETYYKALDKRTKEYKEWIASREEATASEPKGLGDTIEKITTATGIKAAVKFLAGEDCGCTERKDSLNKIFPYKKIECLTEEEYNYLVSQMKETTNVVSQTVQLRMLKIYNRVFNDKKQPTSCGSCFKVTYNALKKLIDEYNQ